MRKLAQFGLLAFYFASAMALWFGVCLLRGDLPSYRWWDAPAIGLIFSAIVMTIKEMYRLQETKEIFEEKGNIIAIHLFIMIICGVIVECSLLKVAIELYPELIFGIPAILGFLIYFFKKFKGFKDGWIGYWSKGIICSFLVIWSFFLWLIFWLSVMMGAYLSFPLLILKVSFLISIIASLFWSIGFSILTIAVVWIVIYSYKSFVFLNRFAFGEKKDKEIQTTIDDR